MTRTVRQCLGETLGRFLLAGLLFTSFADLTRADEPADRISAALFPDPARDLPPGGWWWAKSAGAVYQPPRRYAESKTPAWMQTIEVSTARGYVFKPYGNDGSGSWCRPEKNGKCDLPFQRVEANIQDFTIHGGQAACLQSLKATRDQWRFHAVSPTRLTWTRKGNDNDQNGTMLCANGFHVSVIAVGHPGPSDPSVVRFYGDLIEARILGANAPVPSARYDMTASCDYFADGHLRRRPRIAISGDRIWFRFDGTLDNFHFGCNTAEVAEIWEIWEGRISGSGERLMVEGSIHSRVRVQGGGDYCDGTT